MNNYVFISNLADELIMDKANLRRYLEKKGIEFLSIRNPNKRNQMMTAISLEDSEFIKEEREKEGYTKQEMKIIENGKGYFYIIQLIPELDVNRVKLGYTNSVPSRLQAHKTAAPTAELVKSWPCKKAWESTVIDSVTKVGCKLIANEVYQCESLEILVTRGNDIFNLLPELN